VSPLRSRSALPAPVWPSPREPIVIPLYLSAITAAWVGGVVAGGVEAGSLHISALAAAAGAGTAALAMAVKGRTQPGVAAAAVVALPAAVALALAGHTAIPLAAASVALAGGAVLLEPGRRPAVVPIAAAVAGAGLLVAALVVTWGDLHPGELGVESVAHLNTVAAWLLAGASAGFLLAAATTPERTGLLLLLVPGGLTTAWLVAARIDHFAWAALAATVVGAAVARRPAPVIGLAALAVASVGPARPAAALLAAAAILATGIPHPLALVAALPGVAAFVGFAVQAPVTTDVATAAVALGVVALTTARATWRPTPLDGFRLPSVALLAWLVVAPGSWAWAGDAPLRAYERGAAVAAATGLLVVVAAWAFGQVRPRVEWNSDR
jgi:hypothetical protein